MSRPSRSLASLPPARSLFWAAGALVAACGGGGGFPDARPPDMPGPSGTFSVTWMVTDQNNQPVSCDRVSAQTMTVLTHNLAVEGGQTQIFSCSTGMGMSQAMMPGTYEMSFELASGMFGSLAQGTKQVPVQIEGNANTELQPVAFQVDAVGSVALKLATNKTSNCGATSAGGAGIDQVTIALTHNNNGSCEPVTLTISDGANQPGGTYTVNCTTPMTRGCIETDQTITASSVPSDSYTIKVRGMVAGKACWVNMDSLQVPPQNKLLIRTLNLGQQTQTPGC